MSVGGASEVGSCEIVVSLVAGALVASPPPSVPQAVRQAKAIAIERNSCIEPLLWTLTVGRLIEAPG
jgi:hypothetical protein